jgi:hypothetical protein
MIICLHWKTYDNTHSNATVSHDIFDLTHTICIQLSIVRAFHLTEQLIIANLKRNIKMRNKSITSGDKFNGFVF